MAKFSDRIGVTKPQDVFQLNSMNDELKNSLWNVIIQVFPDDYQFKRWHKLLKFLFIRFFKLPIDIIPEYEYKCRDIFKEKYFKLKWYDVYNIFEIFFEKIDNLSVVSRIDFEKTINNILKEELSSYTFINGEFVPITNPQEIESIKEALTMSINKGLNNVSEHITKALSLLSKKPNPDYHNSIKESISAIEGICKKLTGEKSGGLKKAIDILSEKIQIHSALKEAYLKLYGYTSNEDGIRHSMLEDSNVGFAEAKYMLVSCSAFINYIINKAVEAKLI